MGAKTDSSGAVFYGDGATQVLPGDHVEMRVWAHLFTKESGVVTYVPGISKLHREMEHGGLAWAGIRLGDGTVVGSVVDPNTRRLKKGIKFVCRGEPTEELRPGQPLEG